MATAKPTDPQASTFTFLVHGRDEHGKKFSFHVTDPDPKVGARATGKDIKTGKLVTITIAGRNTPTVPKPTNPPGSTG